MRRARRRLRRRRRAGRSSADPRSGAGRARALRDAGTFRFVTTYSRTRADAPDRPETYMTSKGAVDLAAGRGGLEVSPAGLDDAGKTEEPITISWEGDAVVARIDGERRRLPRRPARESGGLTGRLPDEPADLVELLARGGEAIELGTQVSDGRETAGYCITFDRRTAGRTRIPAELSGAFAAGTRVRSFVVETWLDAESIPRGLAYVVEIDEVRSGGRLVLPERTFRATYDASGYGEPVDTRVAEG